MQKKAELIPYAVISLILGAVLLLMFLRASILFGSDTARIDDYIIKDVALFLTTVNSIPGNIHLNFFYPFHDKVVKINSTHVIIHPVGDELLEGQFIYRTIGDHKSGDFVFERKDFFEISKAADNIKINEPANLDALPCYVIPGENRIDSLRFLLTNWNNERQVTSDFVNILRSSIYNSFAIIPNINNFNNRGTFFDVDQSIVISLSESDNDFIAYVHYKNKQGMNFACNIINSIMSNKNIEGNRYMVYSIDPIFYEINGEKLDKNMVYFELGNRENFISNQGRLIEIFQYVFEEYR